MSMFDKLRSAATRAVDQHGEKISRGLDKAADAVDKRTKHKYSSQIRTGLGKTKQGLERLDKREDRDLGDPGGPGDPGKPGGPGGSGGPGKPGGPRGPDGPGGSTPPR